MAVQARQSNWRTYVGICCTVLAVVTFAAAATRLWVLTAIPIGFLFGFFLQKGDLCGASAFSEVLLMKDWRKIWGLWVCIVTGMVGFAALDLLGWVKLNPKPLLWANYVVGGILFGIGMVLAGGCISGCLFKSGTGNLNSMVGLLGIALGVSFVEHGPLLPVHAYLKKHVIKAGDGGAITFSSLTGLPFWAITLILAGGTLIVGLLLRQKARAQRVGSPEPFSLKRKILARTWRPWQAGLMIGLLGSAAYLSSAAATGRNYPLGVTHGVMHVELLITDRNLVHDYRKPPTPLPEIAKAAASKNSQTNPVQPAAAHPTGKKVSWWLIALVTSLVAGSWVSGRLSGEARLLPKPPEQTVIAFFGGLLVGAGAAFATGCVVGNIMSGWALMSVGMVLFGVVTVLANWAATYVYLMGGGVG